MSASAARETRPRSDDFERSAARNGHRDGLFGVLSAASALVCLKTRCASSCSDLP